MDAHIVSSYSHISFFKEEEEKNFDLLAQSDFTFTFLSCKHLVNITFFDRDFVPVHISKTVDVEITQPLKKKKPNPHPEDIHTKINLIFDCVP